MNYKSTQHSAMFALKHVTAFVVENTLGINNAICTFSIVSRPRIGGHWVSEHLHHDGDAILLSYSHTQNK